MDELEVPLSAASLFLARGPDVERLRPILTGDVFTDVEIPGLPGPGLALVVTHPCAMRQAGGALRDRVTVVRVREYQHLPFSAWRTGHFKVLPLPELRIEHLPEHFAADFELVGTVSGASLDLGKRLACLSDYGISILQQRRVHNETRVVVGLSSLHDQLAPNLEEAELLQEWMEALVADPTSEDQVTTQTAAFDAVLSASDGELREMLKDPVKRADVRRGVRAEIKLRSVG